MDMKMLAKREDRTTVLLVYPDTADEYGRAIEVLARPVWPVAGLGPDVCCGSAPNHAPYVVTTAAQRNRWDLPDLTPRSGACVVDEARALVLLHDGASEPHTAATPFPGHIPQSLQVSQNGRLGDSALDDALAISARGARLDAVLDVLEAAGVPLAVRETLASKQDLVLASGDTGFKRVRGRLQTLLDLPWQRSEPQGFDRAHVAEALGRTHGVEMASTKGTPVAT